MLFPSFAFRKHKELVQDFITNILELDYSTTVISPRSSLSDFFLIGDIEDFEAKIQQRYGVIVSDIPDGNLALIFERIAQAQRASKKQQKRFMKTKKYAGTILHITSLGEWQHAMEVGFYQTASLSSEGFIHCSRPEQVPQVAKTLFRGQTGLVLLCIDRERVAAPVREENLEGGVDLFPHIYGPLNLDAVYQVINFVPGPDGLFELPAELCK
jgi:uncharacterized protein (DUF952 family)